MTREEAEEVWMAWQCGFEHERGKIAVAIAILKGTHKKDEVEE